MHPSSSAPSISAAARALSPTRHLLASLARISAARRRRLAFEAALHAMDRIDPRTRRDVGAALHQLPRVILAPRHQAAPDPAAKRVGMT